MRNMAKALFSAKAKAGVPLSLYPILNGLTPEQSMVQERVPENPSVPAKLHQIVVAALCKMVTVTKGGGSFGKIANDNVVGYLFEMEHCGQMQAAVIQFSKDHYVMKAAKKVNGAYASYTFKEGKDDGVLLITAILFMAFYAGHGVISPAGQGFANQYLSEKIDSALKLLLDGIDGSLAKFANKAACVSECLYRRLTCPADDPLALNIDPLNEAGQVEKISALAMEKKKYQPSEDPIFGVFHFFASETNEVKPAQIEKIGRKWTEEEKLLIPKIEDWYVEPAEVGVVCQLIQKSTGTNKPKRNFMFRGPSSTGKTSMARAIAAKLGMPYTYITCSADTESYAFLGQPMYDTNGNVRYVESDFIRAIKNGYLVEVQEPYVIAKQGVLTALNGILDDTAAITLATGEVVRRHPDSIVIFTTNVTYQGCKKPNQSVIRRMNNVFDINMPCDEEVMKRVTAVTQFKDTKLLKKMLSFMHKTTAYLRDQCVDDGVCGVSELIDWVQTVQCIGDVCLAAESTVISKASDDEEIQAYLSTTAASLFGEDSFSTTQDVTLTF